jgi:hypothetical protein
MANRIITNNYGRDECNASGPVSQGSQNASLGWCKKYPPSDDDNEN